MRQLSVGDKPEDAASTSPTKSFGIDNNIESKQVESREDLSKEEEEFAKLEAIFLTELGVNETDILTNKGKQEISKAHIRNR
jgi:hypothetical protein